MNNLFRNNVDIEYAGIGDPVGWRTRYPRAFDQGRAQARATVHGVGNYIPFDADTLAFGGARAIGQIQRRRRQQVPLGDPRRNYRLHVIVQAKTAGHGGVGNGGWFNLGRGHQFDANASAYTVNNALRDSIDEHVTDVLQRGNLDEGSEDGLQRIIAVVVHAIWRPPPAGGCDSRVHARTFMSECGQGFLQCMTVKSSGNNCAFATLLHQAMSLHLKAAIGAKDAEVAGKIKAFPKSAKSMRSALVKNKVIGHSELVQPEHLSRFAEAMEVNLRVFSGLFDANGAAKVLFEIDFGNGWRWCELVLYDGHYYRVRLSEEKQVVCDKCHAVTGGYHLCYSQRCDDCGLLVQPDHMCMRKRQRVDDESKAGIEEVKEADNEPVVEEERRSGPSIVINDAEELSDEQVRHKLLARLSASDKHILIHGAGGTGKSEYIKFIKRSCRQANKNCELTSTTGISAVGINGTTVHRALGIGLNGRVARGKVKWLQERYSELDWLVIDECSMLPGKLLTSIDCALRLARPRFKDKMFGGVRLILVGDTLQLPVVNGHAFYDSATWYDMETELEVIYLSKLYRFTDERWSKILNKVRIGMVDSEVKNALQSRQMSAEQWDEFRNSDKVYTVLCPTRSKVDSSNKHSLAKLAGEVQELKSDEETVIKLKVGASVMLTRNHLFDLYGLANGSQGKVVQIHQPAADATWTTGWVDVRFQRSDMMVRVRYIKENVDERTERWVLPLQLCFALTIHKSQGATLDCVVADLGRSVFADGQAYVALSRVRSMDGLHLLDLDLGTVRVNLHQLRFENWVRKRDRVHFGRRGISHDEGSDVPLQLRPHPLSNTFRLISADVAAVEESESKVQDREMGLSNVPAPRTASSMDEMMVVTQRAKGRTKVFDIIVFDFETYPSEQSGEHIVYGVAAKLRSLVYDDKQKKNTVKAYRLGGKSNCPPTDFMATLGVGEHADTPDLSKAFFDWVMQLVSFQEHQWETTKHRKSVRPLYLCAYNGNRFDLFWFARYFIGHESYSSKYTTHLLTRGSSALIQMRLFSALNLKMPVLVTHDICDILHMSLSQAVSSYGGIKADGKDVWPHFYLNDETYANLRQKKRVKVALTDFPKSSRSQVQRLVAAGELDLDNYDLYGTYSKYLSKDVDALVDVYRGFDEVCTKYSQGAHVFDFSTMAQLTWYCFVATLPKQYLTSQADGSKLRRDRGKLLTKMYRLSKEDDEFISQAIYGGCVFPRATSFSSTDFKPGVDYDDVKDYLVDADICSMYVHIMMTREYPFGEPRYANDEMIAEYEALMTAGKYEALPMGIYEIEYRYDPHELHPSVPHRDSKGRLLWANCAFDPETGDFSTGKFIRACVTSVDLQNIAILSKAEVKSKVFKAYVWPMQGKLFETWVSKTFQLKNDASKVLADPTCTEKQRADAKAAKSFGKLMGNACYGASAMRDVRGQFVFVRDEHELELFFQDYEWTDVINTKRFCEGLDNLLVLKGTPKITDVNKMCRRPRYLGAFTLSYSRQMIARIVNAANPLMRKSRLGIRKIAIKRQPLYGDTDSLFVTAAAAATLYRKGFFGNEHGKLTDDQYDDWDKGTQSNGLPQWGKIVSAFFPAPKTYAVRSLLPDGSFKDGVRAKGIPNHKNNDIEITIGDEVLTKLDFDTVMKMKSYCADNSEFGTPILVKAKHRMKRMGLNLHGKQREECQELYTIHPAELEREMFKTKWSGRQYVELDGEGIEFANCISQYTVPHGYDYK